MTTEEKRKEVIITLTPELSEELFYDALCNGAGYVQGYGVEIDAEREDEYQAAKEKLMELQQGDRPCIEDIWMQVLKMGNKLQMTDIEGEGAYTRTITLKDVHERVAKIPLGNLCNLIEENDDVDDADVLLQTVFLEEVIFG